MRRTILLNFSIVVLLFTLGILPSVSAPFVKTDTAAIQVDPNKHQEQTRFEIDALNNLSTSVRDSSQEASFDLATKAMTLARMIGYKRGEAYANINLGLFFFLKRTYLESLECFMAALVYARANKDAAVVNEVNKGLEVIFMGLGRSGRSIEYARKVIVYSKKKNIISDLVGAYVNLGQLLFNQGDTNEAFILHFNALSLKPKLKTLSQKIWLMKSIGNLYLSIKNYDYALYYYREAIKENPSDRGNLNGTICAIIAHTYEQISDFDQALYYNRLSLTFRKKENQSVLATSSLINIGYTFLRMGDNDSALHYIVSGLREADLNKINYLREAGYKNLYHLYLAKRNWEKALSALQTYDSVQDIVENERNKDQVTLMENNRIVNEKEKQTGILRAENEIHKLEVKNRNLLVLLLIAISLLAIALAVYIQHLLDKNRIAKKQIEVWNYQLQDEIQEQVIQNEELSKREQEYRFLADHSADLITLMDHNFKCLYTSPSCELFIGYTPKELMDLKDFRELVLEDSKKSFALDFEGMMNYRDTTRFVYQAMRKDGSTFWAESNINPIFESPTGTLKAMLSVTRDISEHVVQEEAFLEAAKQQEILIREVHHRVKNNLAILTSLVNMQKSEFTDHKTQNIFSDLQFRVKAMALVHDQLYRSRNIEVLPIREYLSKLVGIVSAAFSTSRIDIHQDFYDEIVDVEFTLPLGLIVNELLTNAFKYAFPGNKTGNIWVSYEKAPSDSKHKGKMRCLTVKDDGIGLPAGFNLEQQTSMGSQVVHLLTSQLEGELTIDGTAGASFSILLPLER